MQNFHDLLNRLRVVRRSLIGSIIHIDDKYLCYCGIYKDRYYFANLSSNSIFSYDPANSDDIKDLFVLFSHMISTQDVML